MSGPYVGPTNEERLAEKLEKLQSSWDWAKELFENGHCPREDGSSYTCPQCFVLVNFWFLGKHDEWHRKAKLSNIIGPGFIGV